MAKSGNNMNNNKSRSSKPYDASNSFVKKVASRVTGLIPQSTTWLTGWFSPSAESRSGEKREHSTPSEDVDDFQDAFEQPPPTKRIKLPETQQYPKDAFNRGSSSVQGESSKRLVQSDFLDISSVPGPSGHQSHSTGFLASTPAVMPMDHQEPKANGDNCSESGESTSGCSSLEPQINRGAPSTQAASQTRQNETISSRKRLLDEKLNYSYMQNSRSLFADCNLGTRNNRTVSRRNQPSFCVNTFGSPLFGDRSSLNDLIVNSPFYAGRTMYGGASSYRRSLGSASLSSSPANSDKLARHTIKVKPSTSQSTADSSMSQTARRILATLEQFSTPVLDAKRIPVLPQEPPLAGTSGRKRARTEDASEPRLVLEQARVPQRTPKSLHWAGGVPNTARLTVPAVPDTLVLRRRERLQDSTTAARLIASAAPVTDMTCGLEAYKLRTEDSGTKKNTLKMKQPPKTRREKEIKEPELAADVNLPKIALPIASLPSFDISVPPAPTVATAPSVTGGVTPASTVFSKSSVPSRVNFFTKPVSSSPKPQQTFSSPVPPPSSDPFSFSSPIRISNAENDHTASPVNNFIFSKPLPAAGTLKNSVNFTPKLKSTDLKSDLKDFPGGLKPASELRTGSVMDILGKGNKDSTVSKELNGSVSLMDRFKPAAGSWECDKCMIRNMSDVTRCVACTNPRESTSDPPASSEPVSTPAAPVSKSSLAFGSQFKMASGMWECSSCMVRNKDSDEKCVACTGPKPGVKPPSSAVPGKPMTTASSGFSGWGDKFKPAGSTWECEACMLRNAADLTACPACTTKRPGTANAPAPTTANNLPPLSSWGEKFMKPKDSWDCGDCFVTNKGSDLKCVACRAKKPGTENSPPSPTISTPKFSFGIPSAESTTGASDAPSFTFGVSSNKDDKEKSASVTSSTNFKFGVSTPNTSVGFSFGVPTTASPTVADSKSATYSFGVPSATAEKKEPEETSKPSDVATFTFGRPTPQPTSSTEKPANESPVSGKRKHSDDSPSSSASVIPTLKFGASNVPAVTSAPAISTLSSAVSSTSGPVFSFSATSGLRARMFGQDTITTSTASTSQSAFETSSTVSHSSAFPKLVCSPTSSATIVKAAPTFSMGSTLSKDESVTSTWKAQVSSAGASAKTNADSTVAPSASKPVFAFGSPISSSGMMFGTSVSTTSATPTFSFGSTTDSNKTALPKEPVLSFGSSATTAAPVFGASSTTSVAPLPAFGSTANQTFGSSAPAGTSSSNFVSSVGATPSFGSSATSGFGSSFGSACEEKKSSSFAFNAAVTTQTLTPQTASTGFFTFGSSAPTANGPAKPDFGFGSSSAASPPFGGFNSTQTNPTNPGFGFGSQQTTVFGSSTPAQAASPFGAAATTSNTTPFGPSSTPAFSAPPFGSAPASSGGFSFSGTSSTLGGFGDQNATQPAAAPSPFSFGQTQPVPSLPSFDPNAKPSFNFTGGNAVPHFAASPSSEAAPRRIKKATRRAPTR